MQEKRGIPRMFNVWCTIYIPFSCKISQTSNFVFELVNDFQYCEWVNLIFEISNVCAFYYTVVIFDEDVLEAEISKQYNRLNKSFSSVE